VNQKHWKQCGVVCDFEIANGESSHDPTGLVPYLPEIIWGCKTKGYCQQIGVKAPFKRTERERKNQSK